MSLLTLLTTKAATKQTRKRQECWNRPSRPCQAPFSPPKLSSYFIELRLYRYNLDFLSSSHVAAFVQCRWTALISPLVRFAHRRFSNATARYYYSQTVKICTCPRSTIAKNKSVTAVFEAMLHSIHQYMTLLLYHLQSEAARSRSLT